MLEVYMYKYLSKPSRLPNVTYLKAPSYLVAPLQKLCYLLKPQVPGDALSLVEIL